MKIRTNEYRLMKAVTWAMCLSLLLVIWLMPAFSGAQGDAVTPAEPTVAQEVISWVLKIVFSILGMLATWLVTKGIGYVEKKTKIDIPASAETMLYDWADRGVGFAYEKSHQMAKEQGAKLKGPEKMEVAVKFVKDLAKEHGYDQIAETKIKDYVESRLGLKRKDNNSSVLDAEGAVES